ncbi:MAG TPA: LamG domain-containing protein, partial [Polyangiaceae bacterium]|nr:LamG domain-containing protein [Polyangiaceae bacterium]
MVTGTTAVQASNWYFVAICATENGAMRLYVNGKEEGSSTPVGMMWGGGDRFQFGSNSGGGFNWFQGVIDDVRVYDQTLTATDLAALMTAAPYPFAFSPQPGDG